MTDYIGLDYETWSRTSLPDYGLDNYVRDPEFRVHIASVSNADVTQTFDWVFNCIWRDGERIYNAGTKPEFYETITFQYETYLMVDAEDQTIMAHNVGFERAVTKWMLPDFDLKRMQDSAVDARMLGAESKLEVASRQLTNSHKLEAGHDLVMLFCVPNKQYPDGPTPELIEQHGHMDKWMLFIEYCEMDARASRDIRLKAHEILDVLHPGLLEKEAEFEWDLYLENQAGWHVDLPLVKQMKLRSWANTVIAKREFMTEQNTPVNFNSPKQLKKYCEDRDFPVKSLDKYHVPVYISKVKEEIKKQNRLDATPEVLERVTQLTEVLALLETKAEIGGSMLSKLPKILDLTSADGRLRDQYMHVGAGQTFRTTGKGVQMQNLARLQIDKDGNPLHDVDTLYDLTVPWDNTDMAGNLRQVFNSHHPEGGVIVGDFSSVESRGLAWLAQEDWKIDAYKQGKDVYKVLASKFFDVPYDEVTKEQRPRGKYSELSCGYQASPAVLQEFMFKLGFDVSDEVAAEDVENWRAANPRIKELWGILDERMKTAVKLNAVTYAQIGNDLQVRITPFSLPSIQEQHPGALSLCVQILLPDMTPFVTRFVHGCYFQGKTLCYYKAADKYTGQLWKATYQHPKLKNNDGTPKEVYWSIYGGKLAGILTQSFCREMFKESLHELYKLLDGVPNAVIVGEFHDEIAVEWWPGELSREHVMELVEQAMSTCRIAGFPLVADVKYGQRYIK